MRYPLILIGCLLLMFACEVVRIGEPWLEPLDLATYPYDHRFEIADLKYVPGIGRYLDLGVAK